MTASLATIKEFCWIIKEKALGVPMDTPVAGTDSIYIRLSDGNFLNMYAAPIVEEIMYGGGFAVPAEEITDHYECKGTLKTILYPTQAKMLMDWGCTRVNSGKTVPWTQTTEPQGDLASCTVYHAVRRSDGTFKRHKFLGVKVHGLTLEVSRGSTSFMLSLDLVGGQEVGNAYDGTPDVNSTEFPAPVEGSFPTSPYTFRMTSGGLTIASVRSQYESLSFKVTNALDARFFESSYVQWQQFCGRNLQLDAALMLKASPDDRAALEALTAQTPATLVVTNGVTNQNMTLQMNGKSIITNLPYDLPLSTTFMVAMSLKNVWDPTALSAAGDDFTISFS